MMRKPLHIIICRDQHDARRRCTETAAALAIAHQLVKKVAFSRCEIELTGMRVLFMSARSPVATFAGLEPDEVTYTCGADSELVDYLRLRTARTRALG